MLEARENLMEIILAFLKEYDHIPPEEKCMALLLAEERFLKIKQAVEEKQNQPEEEPTVQSFTPYGNFSMIDDVELLMKDIYTFLRKFSRIPFGVTPKVLLIAWERFDEIKHAFMDKQYQQEDIQELMSKLLEDVRNINEELSEYINCPNWNRPTFYDDDDEYTVIYRKTKAITPDLPIEEPNNSLSMGDEHLNTISETKKSSVENLIPIPSEFKGISEDICDNDHSDAKSLLSQDIPIMSPKIDFLSEEFTGKFVSIPPGMNEDEFDEEEDDCYNTTKRNEDQEEKEFDLEDIFQIQDVILREKLLNVHRLITNIESLNNNPTPDFVFNSPSSFPIPVVDSDSFFEESDTSLSHSEFNHFISICHFLGVLLRNHRKLRFAYIWPDASLIDTFNELNDDQRGSEIDFSQNVGDDDSFTFVIRTFLPFLTYPEVSPLSCSTGSEDTIFDPGIFIFHFPYLEPVVFSMEVSYCSP
ncbi:hypothetical protein Tco_0712810 [Tanacetum coccineum]